jgi:hypothetical protein
MMNNRIEISLPIFIRPIMKEILSIGKSIKIVRYLDKIKIEKEGFEELADFAKAYQFNLNE